MSCSSTRQTPRGSQQEPEALECGFHGFKIMDIPSPIQDFENDSNHEIGNGNQFEYRTE